MQNNKWIQELTETYKQMIEQSNDLISSIRERQRQIKPKRVVTKSGKVVNLFDDGGPGGHQINGVGHDLSGAGMRTTIVDKKGDIHARYGVGAGRGENQAEDYIEIGDDWNDDTNPAEYYKIKAAERQKETDARMERLSQPLESRMGRPRANP